MIVVTRFQGGLGAAPVNTLRAWPASVTRTLAIIKPLAQVADPSRPMGLDSTPGYQFMEAIAHFAHLPRAIRVVIDPLGGALGERCDVLSVHRDLWNAFRNTACGRSGGRIQCTDTRSATTLVGVLEAVASAASGAAAIANFGTDITTAINDVKSRIDQLNDEVRANDCPGSSSWTLMTPIRIPTYMQAPPPPVESKMSTGAKVGIFVGIVALVGAIAYAMK